jgi:hypothetical protein
MRGAYGKPVGLVGRVRIGSKIMSIRTKPANLVHANEALRRCKFKFPGRQNIVASNKYGFSAHDQDVFATLQEQGRVVHCGDHATVVKNKGRLTDSAVLIVKPTHRDVYVAPEPETPAVAFTTHVQLAQCSPEVDHAQAKLLASATARVDVGESVTAPAAVLTTNAPSSFAVSAKEVASGTTPVIALSAAVRTSISIIMHVLVDTQEQGF